MRQPPSGGRAAGRLARRSPHYIARHTPRSSTPFLQSIPDLPQPPFEITLETPQKAPLHRQVDGLVAALQTILTEFRYLQAVAQNI